MRRKYLILLLLLSILLVGCNEDGQRESGKESLNESVNEVEVPKNGEENDEDFLVVYDIYMYNKGTDQKVPYERYLKGQVRNISDRKIESINVKVSGDFKNEGMKEFGSFNIESLNPKENYNYVQDIEDVVMEEVEKYDRDGILFDPIFDLEWEEDGETKTQRVVHEVVK